MMAGAVFVLACVFVGLVIGMGARGIWNTITRRG